MYSLDKKAFTLYKRVSFRLIPMTFYILARKMFQEITKISKKAWCL
jgi:hypothetical protein